VAWQGGLQADGTKWRVWMMDACMAWMDTCMAWMGCGRMGNAGMRACHALSISVCTAVA